MPSHPLSVAASPPIISIVPLNDGSYDDDDDDIEKAREIGLDAQPPVFHNRRVSIAVKPHTVHVSIDPDFSKRISQIVHEKHTSLEPIYVSSLQVDLLILLFFIKHGVDSRSSLRNMIPEIPYTSTNARNGLSQLWLVCSAYSQVCLHACLSLDNLLTSTSGWCFYLQYWIHIYDPGLKLHTFPSHHRSKLVCTRIRRCSSCFRVFQ